MIVINIEDTIKYLKLIDEKEGTTYKKEYNAIIHNKRLKNAK